MQNMYSVLVVIGLMFITIGIAFPSGVAQYVMMGIGLVILAVSVFKLLRMDTKKEHES